MPRSLLPKHKLSALIMLGSVLAGTFLPAYATLAVPVMHEKQKNLMTRFYYESAMTFASQGDMQVADDFLYKIYLLNENDFAMALSYAEFLESQGHPDRAINLYERMMVDFKAPEKQSLIQYHIAMVNDTIEAYPKAIKAMHKAISLCPGQPPAVFYYNMGLFYAKTHQLNLSKIFNEKAVKTAPNSSAAWNNLGFTLAQLGQLEAGYKAVKHSLDIDPNNANALDSMGFILFKLHRFKESILTYINALKADPTMTESRLYLGKSYEAIQDWRNAVQTYEIYLENTDKQDPQYKAVQMDIHRLKAKLPIQDFIAPETAPANERKAGDTSPKSLFEEESPILASPVGKPVKACD